MEPERLALDLGPRSLIEAVGGYGGAPALPEGVAERGQLLEGLHFGVDALAGAAVVSRPAVDQAPPGELRLSAFKLGRDDEVLVGGRDVEPRPIARGYVFFILEAERSGDPSPLVPGQGESPEHFRCPLPQVRILVRTGGRLP